MKARAQLSLAAFVLVLTLAACGSTSLSGSPTPGPSEAAMGSAAQRSEGGQVTVVASWTGAAAGVRMDIQLDTHSVDLDSLDLSGAILRNDRGEALSAREWAAPKGGHHRAGPLTFEGDAAAFLAGARWIELVLIDVGDMPERRFRWRVG